MKVVRRNSANPNIVSFQAIAPRDPEMEVVHYRATHSARLERRRNPHEEAEIIKVKNEHRFDWEELEDRKRKREQEEGIPNVQYVYSDTANSKQRNKVRAN